MTDENPYEGMIERRATDDDPVLVCDKCGRGFLTAQPHSIDQFPLWVVVSTMEAGPLCTGTIRLLSRPAALRLASKQELYNAGKTLI